jgi:hypothetical protein
LRFLLDENFPLPGQLFDLLPTGQILGWEIRRVELADASDDPLSKD